MRLALALLVAAAPALADTPLTAEAFDTLTRGRTMGWADRGQVYGVEFYLPDRRVLWTANGDVCLAGHWYAEGPAICFLYDDRPAPVCWKISTDGPALTAVLVGDPPGTPAVTIAETSEPLGCFGPGVGS